MIQNIILGFLAAILVGLSLIRPKKGVAMVLVGALVFTGMTSYFAHSWSHIAWVISIASIALLLPSIFALSNVRGQKGNLLSVAMAIFCLFAILSLITNFSKIEEAFAAAKNIFQFWSIPLLAYVGIVDRKVKTNLSKLLLIIAFIQIPVSLYQHFFVVDWATRIGGGDSIVGTFGGSSEGGGDSGAQTTFLLIIWTFMVAIYIQQKKVRSIWLMASFLLLIPVLLNETKIFFFYLPFAILQLFLAFSISRPTRTIFVTGLMGSAGFGVLIFYFLFLQHTGYGMSKSKDVESYLEQRVSSSSGLNFETHEELGLTRLGSIIYWWDEHSLKKNSINMLLGHGLGASKGSGLYLGHLYDEPRYRKLRLDRTGLAKFLWDIGILGTLSFIMVFITAYFMLSGVLHRQGKTSIEVAIMTGAKIGLSILLIGNLYDTYLIRNQGLNLTFAILLAYTFYIYRETSLNNAQQKRR